MKQYETRQTRDFDLPIPKPPGELFDDFLRNTEAKLVTKRFINNRETNRNGGARRISEVR